MQPIRCKRIKGEEVVVIIKITEPQREGDTRAVICFSEETKKLMLPIPYFNFIGEYEVITTDFLKNLKSAFGGDAK